MDSTTGNPLNQSGYIAAGSVLNFDLLITAPSNVNASAGEYFRYEFHNDGTGACDVEMGACVVPEGETSALLQWVNFDGTGPGANAEFQVTVTGGAGMFYGREVRERFGLTEGTEWVDSCWFPGSIEGKIDPPNVLGAWFVAATSNQLTGVDRMGVQEDIVLWYQGDQTNMTAAQLAAIAGGAPAPPDLTTTSPYRCGFLWEQRMRMWCQDPQGPAGFAHYLTHPVVIDIVGVPTSVEVTRGTSGVQTTSFP